MIEVKTFTCNPIEENCYVVSDPTGEAVVIDCGAFYDAERKAVVSYIKERGLQLRHVLCTHAHFDHIFGLDTLYEEFGLKPRLHPADQPIYEKMNEQVSSMMGVSMHLRMPPLGDDLSDGEQIGFGGSTIEVLHTPGHSPGSVLFHIKDATVLFSGDTLFRMSVGRTDLEGGSWEQLMDSLQRVVSVLPDNVKVYTGHGPSTYIGNERMVNPYLRGGWNIKDTK